MKLVWTILAVLYALSPFDILPERFLPVIGWLDDLIVLWLLWRAFYAVKNRGMGGSYRQDTAGRDYSQSQRASQGGAAGNRSGSANSRSAKDPYSVLGLSPGASREEIKAAYRRLAAKYHPDKVAHLGEEFREIAEQRFKEIQEAYQRLNR
jgi:DnaJ like chaperone protein